MPPEPDDLLPEQRGAVPPEAVIAEREVRRKARLGQIGRLRSWAAFLAALIVLLVLAYFIRQT